MIPIWTAAPGPPGIIVFASMGGAPISIDGAATVTPAATSRAYAPTVSMTSVGQSEWLDLFTPTAVFKKFSWNSNFPALQGLGLVQGVDFDAFLEVQGTETLSPIPADGFPTTATAAGDVDGDQPELGG